MISKNRKTKGQGATDYVLILVLVAIGSIAVITFFGDNIRGLFVDSSARLQGDTETKSNDGAGTGATDRVKGLDNY